MQLVLASTSKYRRAILDQLGVRYTAASPDYEEDHSLPLRPLELALHFAKGKARSLANQYPDSLIVGADQVGDLDGELLSKPGTSEAAEAQLRSMSGRTHRLISAMALVDTRRNVMFQRVTIHHMTMKPLTDEMIRWYVTADDPIDCSGSYRIESRGLSLFADMRGSDHSGIVGLPVTSLSELLAESGHSLFDFLE
ncbi:MAG: septum formation protein Maf [Myxococcales bacterium]|nr:septum formation protein Maf [Myxococcales bacterium]